MQTALRWFAVFALFMAVVACERPSSVITYSGGVSQAVVLCRANPQLVAAEVIIDLGQGVFAGRQLGALWFLRRHGCLKSISIKNHGPTDEEYDLYHLLRQKVTPAVTIM